MGGFKVYLKGIPQHTKEHHIKSFFKGYGRVNEIIVGKEFAFIDFEEIKDAEDAIESLNGKQFLGVQIAVESFRQDHHKNGVEFASHAAMEVAIRNLDGTLLKDERMRLVEASGECCCDSRSGSHSRSQRRSVSPWSYASSSQKKSSFLSTQREETGANGSPRRYDRSKNGTRSKSPGSVEVGEYEICYSPRLSSRYMPGSDYLLDDAFVFHQRSRSDSSSTESSDLDVSLISCSSLPISRSNSPLEPPAKRFKPGSGSHTPITTAVENMTLNEPPMAIC